MGKRGWETTYEQWMRQEGLPIVSGYGVKDVREIELGPWPRLGGRGAFIQLAGMEGLTGMYVGEIQPGAALAPEKHLFEELIYILSGHGATQVWSADQSGPKRVSRDFEWQTGSLFSPPLNTWHRLLNASGNEPVRFLAATNAPLVIDLFHNADFVTGCDYTFKDRYSGQADYFNVGDRKMQSDGRSQWFTNFIPDVRTTLVDAFERDGVAIKGQDVRITGYDIAGNVLVGHISEWPVGKYHKAHHHQGGAVLLGMRSRGYALMWPKELGIRPYENGCADSVVKVDWQEGGVFSPPTGWFHQHFNTGPEPARQLAFRYGSRRYSPEFLGVADVQGRRGVHVSVKQGGTLIEFEDEDPEIRRQYLRALAENGVQSDLR